MKKLVLSALVASVFTICFTSCSSDESTSTLSLSFDTLDYLSAFTVYCEASVSMVDNPSISTCGFCWATNDNPTISNDTIICHHVAGTFNGTILFTEANQDYYLRPFATNPTGVWYGDIKIFTTGSYTILDDFIKTLTGFPDQEKHWVLDKDGLYFHNPLDFYGDAEAGGSVSDIWGPFGGTNFYDWGNQGAENGSIQFEWPLGLVKKSSNEGYLYQVTSNINGNEVTETYSFNIYERDIDFLYLTNGSSLWEHMLSGPYHYLYNLSEKMADIDLPDNIRFPIDSTRFYGNYIEDDDLHTITIIHLSDSAMILRIKQTYSNGSYDPRWLLYNYIVEEYTYQ